MKCNVNKDALHQCFFVCASIILLMFPINSFAVSIAASVVLDDLSGPIKVGDIGSTKIYGDFTVVDHGGTTNTGAGDGIDETWGWVFDFTGHENYAEFVNKGFVDPMSGAYWLTKADLTLTIEPKDGLIWSDAFSIGSLDWKGGCLECVPPYKRLFSASQTKYTFDLLDDEFYSVDEIISVFHMGAVNEGQISAIYGDDAVVKRATLTLAVPEPPTALLVAALGLILVAYKRVSKNFSC